MKMGPQRAVTDDPVAGPGGPWVVRRDDVVVLCTRAPQALLVVGQDDQLVHSTAAARGVM